MMYKSVAPIAAENQILTVLRPMRETGYVVTFRRKGIKKQSGLFRVGNDNVNK